MDLIPAPQSWNDVYDFYESVILATGCDDRLPAADTHDKWVRICVQLCKKLPREMRNWLEKIWIKIALREACHQASRSTFKLPPPSKIRWEFFSITWFLRRDEKSKALEILNSFRASYSLDRLELPSEEEDRQSCPHQSPTISYKLTAKKDIHATTNDTLLEGSGRMENMRMTGSTQAFISGINREPSPLSDYDLIESTDVPMPARLGDRIVPQRKSARHSQQQVRSLMEYEPYKEPSKRRKKRKSARVKGSANAPGNTTDDFIRSVSSSKGGEKSNISSNKKRPGRPRKNPIPRPTGHKDGQEITEQMDSDDTVVPSSPDIPLASLDNSQGINDSIGSDDTLFSSLPDIPLAPLSRSQEVNDSVNSDDTRALSSPVVAVGPPEEHRWAAIESVREPVIPSDSMMMPSQPVNKTKLPLLQRPLVWAQSRQELCESLNYFRSYQGGVYSRGNYARGYLLDGHPAKYDLWHNDGRIIISHGGGHSATDMQTGQTALIEDQSLDSPSCNALRHSWQAKEPIVLIAGDRYELFPYAQECSYVVLGYYVITHAWEEPEFSKLGEKGYFVRWKFLFQWVDVQGEPWWIRGSPSAMDVDIPTSAHVFNPCSDCGNPAPDIYASGWVCTNSKCKKFFLRTEDDSSKEARYTPSFLTRQKQMAYTKSSVDVRPTFLVPALHAAQNVSVKGHSTTSRIFWKGFWCRECGRLSCREYWTHWECANCHEKFPIQPIIQPPPPYSAHAGKEDIGWLDTAGINHYVRVIRDGKESFRCYSFVLPFSRGTIHFLQTDPSAAARAVADNIWYQYQHDAREVGFFRRYGMKLGKLKGKTLSQYFSQNSGEKYQYVGGTENTVPLDKYSSVEQAMAWIRRRVIMVLKKDPEFNEILSAAYMEDQKMDFHSDGERDLGPVVTGLSLGSPATMRFRPVPSKWKADGGDGIRKMPPMVITLTLRHGDMVVMDGAEIQEYYQHAVYPLGFRIAATARHIQTKGA